MTQPRLLGGRYELDGIVGRGGMAEVYRARDIRLDRIVAVKTLRDDLARDQTFQARFRREAQSAASLNHPSIVAVYDTGEEVSGTLHIPYIVMEYVDGHTLRELLRNDRRLLPERALEITDGVLGALDYSHRNGIVHRDIKPGNVMLMRNGEVKVMDFGIARAVSDAQATMTQTAQVIGTAQYLSPEQARGERVDARSDLYSTGCLLYELLTSRPPFLGDSPVAIAYQHVRENPVPPSRLDPEIPAWADAIVLKAMAKDPGQRYQSANDMRTDIQRALAGVPVAGPRTGYGPTQRMGPPGTQQATAAVGDYGYGPPEDDGYEGGRGDRGRGRRTALWWVVGSVLALAIVVGAAYALLNSSGPGHSVPQVTGLTLAAAKKDITQHGLTWKVVNVNSSQTKGTVVRTSPPNGDSVPAGKQVTLYVSAGPKKVRVPYLKGKKSTQAESALSKENLNYTTVTDAKSNKPAGTVVKQTPQAGSMVAPGTTVRLWVSQGGLAVPNVQGDSKDGAEQILKNDGFNVQVYVIQGPANDPPGTVVNQSPAPSTQVPPGSTVDLYVQQAAATPSPTPSATPSATPTVTPTPSSTATAPPPGG